VLRFAMAPSSQELEPPGNPARFISPSPRSLAPSSAEPSTNGFVPDYKRSGEDVLDHDLARGPAPVLSRVFVGARRYNIRRAKPTENTSEFAYREAEIKRLTNGLALVLANVMPQVHLVPVGSRPAGGQRHSPSSATGTEGRRMTPGRSATPVLMGVVKGASMPGGKTSSLRPR